MVILWNMGQQDHWRSQDFWNHSNGLTHLGLLSQICVVKKNSFNFPSDAYLSSKSLDFPYNPRETPEKQTQAKMWIKDPPELQRSIYNSQIFNNFRKMCHIIIKQTLVQSTIGKRKYLYILLPTVKLQYQIKNGISVLIPGNVRKWTK